MSIKKIVPIAATVAIVIAVGFLLTDGEQSNGSDPSDVDADKEYADIEGEDRPRGPCPGQPQRCYGQALDELAMTDADSGDVQRAVDLLGSACQQGLALACHDLAILADEGFGHRRTDAAEFFEAACNHGHPPACLSLRRHRSFDRDLPVLLDDCRAGQPDRCIDAGVVSRTEPEQRDKPRAEQLFEQACDGGHAEGCHWLGLHLDRIGSGASDDELEQHYTAGCEAGFSPSCTKLARRQEARSANSSTVLRTLERGCTLDDGDACHHLGEVLGRTGNQQDATEAFERGCRLWHGRSCDRLAGAYIATDRDVFWPTTRGCRLGVQSSCYRLAVRELTNLDFSTDRDAHGLLEQGCHRDHFASCALISAILHAADDGEKAIPAARRACRGGFEKWCP